MRDEADGLVALRFPRDGWLVSPVWTLARLEHERRVRNLLRAQMARVLSPQLVSETYHRSGPERNWLHAEGKEDVIRLQGWMKIPLRYLECSPCEGLVWKRTGHHRVKTLLNFIMFIYLLIIIYWHTDQDPRKIWSFARNVGDTWN